MPSKDEDLLSWRSERKVCTKTENIGTILLSAGTEEAPDIKWSSQGEGSGGAHPRGGLQCELLGWPKRPWDSSSAQPRRGQRLERWVPTPAPLPDTSRG